MNGRDLTLGLVGLVAAAGAASKAGLYGSRSHAKPMMLCPRCSGSERIWVGTPNPDLRSRQCERDEERGVSREFVHPGTYSGWSGCPICTHGIVPASVHDRLTGKNQGSRAKSGEPSSIIVVSVIPHRVGFAGHAVVRNLSRGKLHDPRAIHHVEVTLEAGDPDTLHDWRAVQQVAREAVAKHGIRQGFVRKVSGVYLESPLGRLRWRVRVDVE